MGNTFEWVPKGSQINVDLWIGDCWTEDDLRDLKCAVEQFGVVSGQRSYNLRGMGLHITLAFAAGAIAGGFLNALGEDVYAWLKKRIVEVVRRPYARNPETESSDDSDLLAFIISDDEAKVEMHFYGSYRNEKELEAYLHAAPPAFNAVWAAFKSGRYPCMSGRHHNVLAHWGTSPRPEWDVSIHVRDSNEDGSPWLVNASAFVSASELTAENWGSIHWMTSEEARCQRASRHPQEL